MVATYSCVETSSRLNLKVQLLRVCQSVCSQCVTQASMCQLVIMCSGQYEQCNVQSDRICVHRQEGKV